MAEPYYTTATALRTELGVDNTTLPDADALKIIQNAEDLVDELLGGWPIDRTTLRKVVQANVEAWQWTLLGRSTVKLAAQLYRDPELARRREWTNIKGPDFQVSGPAGGGIFTDVLAPLNQSGLRNLTGRALPGTRVTRYDRFLRATRHDGT